MTEAIKEFFTTVFGSCPWLGVLLIAMIPIVELRGAIPFAMSAAFWGAKALPWWQAYLFSVLGSTIPALLILLLLKPLFAWMKTTKWFKKVALHFETKFKSKSAGINEKVELESKSRKKELAKFWGVLCFVAIPIPLTGAWTGSAVASYLDIKYWKGVLAVLLGNLISGAIMTTVCVLLPGYESIVLYCFLGLAVVVILGTILWSVLKRKKKVEEIVVDETDKVSTQIEK